jgi:hypothetical protein
LHAYSRRCLGALRPSLRAALAPVEPMLALNVEKEVRKDALIIARAAQPAPREGWSALLAQAREIDREFLARLGRSPLRLEIRYDEVEPIRRRRMERLLDAAARLLALPWRGLRPAVRACYDERDFAAVLVEHLRLYTLEVHALNRSLRVPALISLARRVVADRLRAIMDQESKALAPQVARLVFLKDAR